MKDDLSRSRDIRMFTQSCQSKSRCAAINDKSRRAVSECLMSTKGARLICEQERIRLRVGKMRGSPLRTGRS